MPQHETYKDSGAAWIGNIPCTWETGVIGALYTLRNTKVSDSEYPPLSVTMKGIVPQLETAAKTDAHDARKLVLKGDFAINSRSDRRGSCGISDYDGSVSLINTVLTPRGKMNPQYYNWLFHAVQFADEFYKNGHGIVDDLWTTCWNEMKRILIPVPPMEEQAGIADYLENKIAHIDSVIAEVNASIEEYKAWKASIIYEAVTKGLDPNVEMKDSGVEWIGYMPAKWSRTKLSNCFNIVGSGTTPTSDDDSYYIGNINWLQSGDINGGIVKATKKQVSEEAYDKFSALKVYKAPFMAIAMYGASIANTSIVQVDACTNQACCVFSAPNEFIVLEYVFYAVLGAKEELLLSARGGTQPNINQDILKKLMIPIPSKSEQEYIVCSLNFKCGKINELIAEKESLISDLESYKKSLIFEVVTGKRKVV